MQSVIRIGSRESRLAVKQAEIIKDQIRRCDQTILVEIITMKTTGDKILDRSLESVGGKGLFVKRIRSGSGRRKDRSCRSQSKRYADGRIF